MHHKIKIGFKIIESKKKFFISLFLMKILLVTFANELMQYICKGKINNGAYCIPKIFSPCGAETQIGKNQHESKATTQQSKTC